MRLRRANFTARRASSSATAAKRSLCRGTNSRTAFGIDSSSKSCASSSCASSPACVLPAIQTGRVPAKATRSALPTSTMPGSTATSNFTLPTTRVRSAAAPIDLNRSASSADCAATSRLLLNTPANRLPKRRYRDTDLEESRAFASNTGMPPRSHARNRLGHSSVSMMIAARGRVRLRKRLTEAGVSYGRKRMSAPPSNNAAARALPAGVAVVTTSGVSGKRNRSARANGAAADISPSETACSQILGAASARPTPMSARSITARAPFS